MVEGKTAFVTGGNRGIGYTIAERLVEEGANVAIAARSEQTVEAAEELGTDHALPVTADVTDEASVAAGIEETVEHFGGLDILVNNAGVAGPIEPIEEMDSEGWREAVDVNLNGVFYATKHAIPHLRESDRASIVTISSITGKRPAVNRSPYAATKIAVIGFTRTLAVEVGADGITANTICPSATESPRIDGFVENHAEETGLDYEAALDDLGLNDNALGTLVTPEDTADLIVFLASEQGRHITGQDINVDAGTIWY